MNGYTKEVKSHICKSHSARSEKESYRVCPSKLSKTELEDLYFKILENNVELKKTINGQQEKIKVLSTKVQRMTVSTRTAPGKENECCTGIKTMVNNQKLSIADLKIANERMSEKIKALNMRLCSAKQFLRRNSALSMTRCARCYALPVSLRNSSASILHAKTSSNTVKSVNVSSQYIDKDVGTTRSVETVLEEPVKDIPEKQCNENKCQSLIEELKQKIVNLQEELGKTHEEYSMRISSLEGEVGALVEDRDRSRLQRAAAAQQLQHSAEQAALLAARLRAAEAQYSELALELSIEKRQVAELEMRVKAVDWSGAVAKTIEDHLSNIKIVKNEIADQQLDTSPSPFTSPRWDKSHSRLDVPGEIQGLTSDATDRVDQTKMSKMSDDSGFMDKSPMVEQSKYATCCMREDIEDKLRFLQDQLDTLKKSDPARVRKTDENVYSNLDKMSPDEVRFSTKDDKTEPAEYRANTENSDTFGKLHRIANVITALRQDISKNKKTTSELGMKEDGRNFIKRNTDEVDREINTKISENCSNQKPDPVPVNDANTETPIKRTGRRRSRQRSKQNSVDIELKKQHSIKHNSNDESTINGAKQNISNDVDTGIQVQNCNTKTQEVKVASFVSIETGNSEVRPEKTATATSNKELSLSINTNNATLTRASKTKLLEMGEEYSVGQVIPTDIKKSPKKVQTAHRVKDNNTNLDTRSDEEADESVSARGPRRRADTYSIEDGNKTYSVPPQSPENTEHEISSLTDLPSERDDKSPRALSPGEHKPTTSYTTSYSTVTTTEHGTLSEGEMPGVGAERQLSLGETKIESLRMNASMTASTSQRMEEALCAITQELALCRGLLHSRRSLQAANVAQQTLYTARASSFPS